MWRQRGATGPGLVERRSGAESLDLAATASWYAACSGLVEEVVMHSPKAWKTPASLVLLALLGVLIAIYGSEAGHRPADAASVVEPAPASDPPSNEIFELPQLG